MRTFTRKLLIAALAAVGIGSLAYALVLPQLFAPRMFSTQQVHYLRINATFNAINGLPCVLVSNKCTLRVGAVPYNAFIVRATQEIVTSFNSATTDTLSLGTTQANANELVAAQSVHGAAGGPTALTLAATGGGIQVTGNGVTSTGGDGGFDIWIQYAQTGAAPTAGQAVVVVEYFAPNDGTCVLVPMGASSPAC